MERCEQILHEAQIQMDIDACENPQHRACISAFYENHLKGKHTHHEIISIIGICKILMNTPNPKELLMNEVLKYI